MMRVCHIGTFPPTQCGIATYVQALIQHQPTLTHLKVRLIYDCDELENDECQIRIRIQDRTACCEVGTEISKRGIDVVSLQHEFGIFGGHDGEYVLNIVHNVRSPLVTTLHTVSASMPQHKAELLRELAVRSQCVVVLSEESKKVLLSSFGIPEPKIRVIHHGVPEISFRPPEQIPLRQTLGIGPVFVSAGHIKPKKGYDLALRAVAKLRHDYPSCRYLIIGSHQPQFDHDNVYEPLLLQHIERGGMTGNVVRINKYLGLDEFVENIQAADIGLVMYSDVRQNSSGILPLILACGRPVIATDFECARSIASRLDAVLLAKSGDSDAVYNRMCELAANPGRTRELMLSASCSTRQWSWAHAADSYLETYRAVLSMPSTQDAPTYP